MERIIFHVDMNAFFAAVEQRYDPALRGKPVVVCGKPDSRTVVAACSYEAKVFGIKNGMSLMEAKRLCPHLVAVGGMPERYISISQQIIKALAEYTPDVEVFSIDEAFMDVTATYAFFSKTPEALAQRIKQHILRVCGLTCSVGIAVNKLMAKVASNLQKPDGLVRIHPERLGELLERLPIEKLCGVGPRLKEILNGQGVFTCAELGQASELMLVRKFGVIGRILKRWGQGIDPTPVLALYCESPVKSMGHAYTLSWDTASDEELKGTLRRLSEQVARRLRIDGYQGKTIGLTIRYEDFTSITRHQTYPFPVDSGLQIYRVAQAIFQKFCEPLAQRVRQIGVGVGNLIRHERQLCFLDDEVRCMLLDKCLDNLADRFGERCVIRASAMKELIPKSHGFLAKRHSSEVTF